MKRFQLHNEPDSDDSGHRACTLMGAARILACAVVILIANLPSSVLAEVQVYEYVRPMGQVSLTIVPTNERVVAVLRKARYHLRCADL